MEGLTLFESARLTFEEPYSSAATYLELRLAPDVFDAIDDLLEAYAPDGLCWALDSYASPYVDAPALLVLSDCTLFTVGVVITGNLTHDERNLRHYLALATNIAERV